MPEDVFYTIEEVARQLKVSQDTIRRLIRERKLEATKIGWQWRVSAEQLRRYVERK